MSTPMSKSAVDDAGRNGRLPGAARFSTSILDGWLQRRAGERPLVHFEVDRVRQSDCASMRPDLIASLKPA